MKAMGVKATRNCCLAVAVLLALLVVPSTDASGKLSITLCPVVSDAPYDSRSACAELGQAIEDALTRDTVDQSLCHLAEDFLLSCGSVRSRPRPRPVLLERQCYLEFSQLPDKCVVTLAYLTLDGLEAFSHPDLEDNVMFIKRLRTHSSDDELVFLLAEMKARVGDHEEAAQLFEEYFSAHPLPSDTSYYGVHRTQTFLNTLVHLSDYCRANQMCEMNSESDPEYGAILALCHRAQEECAQ